MAALLFGVALVCAVLSIALGALAVIHIWLRGTPGTSRVVVGVLFSIGILAIPAVTMLAAAPYPELNDVTTDAASPPPFKAVAPLRSPGTNSVAYRGPKFAARQAKAYPDIGPMLIERPSEEAFDLVIEALKRMKLDIVRQDRPKADPPGPGFIEAVDRTLIMGFYDDVAVRVKNGGKVTRVDMRSASRFGKSDLGRNAERLRELALEIDNRVKATTPTQEELDARAAKEAAKARAAAKAKKRRERRRKRWRRRRR